VTQADPDCPILVVDDDQDIRESVVEILQEQGYTAVGAQDGSEALDILHRADTVPCLILLDLMMPVMDGEAFRAKQLEDPALSEIPVVVVSAYADVEEKAQAMHTSGILKKPVQLRTLIATVQRFCSKDGVTRPAAPRARS
jgi:CheY-like chemotaxis protein